MEESKVEALVPKFTLGQMVKHPLGLKCMVAASYDSQSSKETGETTPLPVVLYDVQFLDKNGCIQVTRIAEPFITSV